MDNNFSMNWITFIRSYGEALTKNHKQNNNYTCTFWSFIQKLKHCGKTNPLVIQALNDCIVKNYYKKLSYSNKYFIKVKFYGSN